MNKYELTEESFNNLIKWLGSNKDSGEKYEEIRFKLIKYFSWNGCRNAEELADEAINIVASKLPQLTEDYTGDPALYFLGVARKLAKKQSPHNQYVPLSPDLKAEDNSEENSRVVKLEKCREECLQKLPERKQKLIRLYYQKGGEHNEDFRESLAAEKNMKSGALRVAVYRIRQELKECFDKCKKKEQSF
ncbi:MAG: hypothetical protein LUM44_06345 [Pyrinomonadaceae bacterium]|nr:hypothetical protein [Pyrinomonadaceae bacterium]